MILHLVRHPPVTKDWQKRCYGQSDPGLSREGKAMVLPIIRRLSTLKPDAIIHSDTARTRAIAHPLAHHFAMVCNAEPLWRERSFGTWEGRTWHSIYRETGDAMDGMLNAPETFRPGGGETTRDLVNRISTAINKLPATPTIIVIAHGGPIAAAQLVWQNLPISQIAALIPKPGSIITISGPAICMAANHNLY